MGDDNTTVTITLHEYNSLLEAAKKLRNLENAGVDNWEGYEHAFDDEDFEE